MCKGSLRLVFMNNDSKSVVTPVIFYCVYCFPFFILLSRNYRHNTTNLRCENIPEISYGWLVGWLVGWLIGRLVGGSIIRLIKNRPSAYENKVLKGIFGPKKGTIRTRENYITSIFIISTLHELFLG
jgi:hypothetical protein